MFNILPYLSRRGLFTPFAAALVAGLVAVLVSAAPGARAQSVPDELNEATLLQLLVGEIALQRGDPALAARTYLDLARSTRDPRVARRAIEVANFARMPEVALESARIWQAAEPASAQALQVLAALLIGSKRVEEAEPYLEKLLSAEGVNLENGFMQLLPHVHGCDGAFAARFRRT